MSESDVPENRGVTAETDIIALQRAARLAGEGVIYTPQEEIFLGGTRKEGSSLNTPRGIGEFSNEEIKQARLARRHIVDPIGMAGCNNLVDISCVF
jgi:hypothetical protein